MSFHLTTPTDHEFVVNKTSRSWVTTVHFIPDIGEIFSWVSDEFGEEEFRLIDRVSGIPHPKLIVEKVA